MSDACLDRDWRLDRRVNLGALVSLACSLCVVVGLVTGLNMRLSAAEDKLTRLETKMETSRGTVLKVERLDERVQAMQQTLAEVRDELRAMREGR